MPASEAYALTRAKGSTGTVTRLTGNTFNSTTGTHTDTEVTTTVRWLVKEHTRYSRLLRASATQQKIGETTFLIYLPDVDSVFTELDAEDYITQGGKRYEVVSSETFPDSIVVTATEVRGVSA